MVVHLVVFSLLLDQNFVDVLEEVASTRGWSGEAVELIIQDPNSGEEYRLNTGTIPKNLISNFPNHHQIIKNQNGNMLLLHQMQRSPSYINFLQD